MSALRFLDSGCSGSELQPDMLGCRNLKDIYIYVEPRGIVIDKQNLQVLHELIHMMDTLSLAEFTHDKIIDLSLGKMCCFLQKQMTKVNDTSDVTLLF